MKTVLRLACGFGVLAGSFVVVGCDGSSEDGVPAVIERNPEGEAAMKKLMESTGTMTPPKSTPPKQGKLPDASAAAPAEPEKK